MTITAKRTHGKQRKGEPPKPMCLKCKDRGGWYSMKSNHLIGGQMDLGRRWVPCPKCGGRTKTAKNS